MAKNSLKIKKTKTKGYRIYFPDGTLFTDNSFRTYNDAMKFLHSKAFQTNELGHYEHDDDMIYGDY